MTRDLNCDLRHDIYRIGHHEDESLGGNALHFWQQIEANCRVRSG